MSQGCPGWDGGGMSEEQHRYWGARPDDRRIREHLNRQRDLDPLQQVRLDDGRVVRIGSDADGEADE